MSGGDSGGEAAADSTTAPRRPIAVGCMRLSTAPDRDEQRAVATLHAALDAGVTLLDTADAYALDENELGHNERLVARALASWRGDRALVRAATKGGMTRPGGRWVPDGRARSLAAACAASRRALGVERIDLYQLHAPDPKVPLATSVRALAALQRDGWIDRIGLCNVSLRQLREALEIAPIAAVQVELGPWRDEALRGGLARFCGEQGIQLFAHRPLGGTKRAPRLGNDPALRAVAARHGATPWEVALAWIADLGPGIVPLPGPTRPETARSAARAAALRLDDRDRAELEARFPAGRAVREPATRRVSRTSADGAECVLVLGIPGAGKSTHAAELVARGYERLNRDETGGRLRGLLPALAAHLAAGRRRVVLDNTYPTRASRDAVLETAAAHGVPVRCVWLDTPLEQAQVNVAERLLRAGGASPGRPSKVKFVGPDALFRWQRDFEPPEPDEGFVAIERVPFARRSNPAHTAKGLICALDGVLRRSRSGARAPITPDDVEILPGRAEALARFRAEGRALAAIAWHPEIAEGTATPEAVAAALVRTAELLGGRIDLLHCPHAAGPPRCWCRKPLPGLGVELVARHRLDPAQTIYAGVDAVDRAFAARLGFDYRDAAELFADP